MTTLLEQLKLLHFGASRFKLANKNQNGLCCFCALKGTQTYAPTRIVVKTRTIRGSWPDRYLCSICASAIAKVHLGVKKLIVGELLGEKLLGVDLTETEEAILRQLSNGESLTAHQLKDEIGGPIRQLPTPQVVEICQKLCDCNLLQRNQCNRHLRYSLAAEVAHAS
jgi:hypothetical protein